MPDTRTTISDIEGVGPQYADLLHKAGVDTVSKLAAANGTLLRRQLASVNAQDALVEELPSESMVVRWVTRARGHGLSLTHH